MSAALATHLLRPLRPHPEPRRVPDGAPEDSFVIQRVPAVRRRKPAWPWRTSPRARPDRTSVLRAHPGHAALSRPCEPLRRPQRSPDVRRLPAHRTQPPG